MCDVSGRSAWQRMPLGVTVVCRGWPWRVLRCESGAGALAADVQPVASDGPAISTFLLPFDRISVRAATVSWRPASRQRVRHVIAALDGGWPEMPLASLSMATIEPWAHQLVPALALTEGRGVRVLVADDVGLGKTMAAGLAIAELAARALAARVLVLTPAGLRDQWRDELRRQLRMAAEVVDASVLAALARDVPADCSPWIGSGCRILSLDFAKQPAVLRSLAQDTWDVLVIDEAHNVAGDSRRAAAVRALALQSRFLLMLTATPHNGVPLAFRKLVSLGLDAARDSLVWIRRGRAELGLPGVRTIRTWRLRATAAEIELQQALHAYAGRVDKAGRPEARLAMIVLRKRALSSADALLCSLQRRLAGLSDALEPVVTTALLPFEAGEIDDGDDVQPAALGAQGLGNVDDELEELRTLIALAERARHTSAKHRTLERIVTRTAEAAILFTEYRDTLRVVAKRLSSIASVAVLHGGLDRAARREAIRRFTSGEARVLVATDAAAEGLNLQARCRFVVHIDLPWSPTTLEQRVGRVDRIGQARQVRVWQLGGAGGHEPAVVAALARRFQRIHADLGRPVPREWAAIAPDESAPGEAVPDGTRVDGNDLAEMAQTIARADRLIRALRCRAAPHARTSRRPTPRGIPWRRSRRAAAVVGRGVVFLFTASPRRCGDARTHITIHVGLRQVPQEAPKVWLPWLATRAAQRAAGAVAGGDRLRARAVARERDLLARSEAEHRRLHGRWQPSLFDERAARVIDVARDRIDRRTGAHARRLDELGDGGELPLVEPVLALIVE
jgi:superfamily II DNA or RNA helicase